MRRFDLVGTDDSVREEIGYGGTIRRGKCGEPHSGSGHLPLFSSPLVFFIATCVSTALRRNHTFPLRNGWADSHSTACHPHDYEAADCFHELESDDESPAQLVRVSFCAHFAEKFGILDGAEEERDSRVERRRERPETGIARVRRGAGRRREERSVVVREKKEKGMNYWTIHISVK